MLWLSIFIKVKFWVSFVRKQKAWIFFGSNVTRITNSLTSQDFCFVWSLVLSQFCPSVQPSKKIEGWEKSSWPIATCQSRYQPSVYWIPADSADQKSINLNKMLTDTWPTPGQHISQYVNPLSVHVSADSIDWYSTDRCLELTWSLMLVDKFQP